MNPLLRALWDRLLPPGGDVAVAREPLDNASTVRWIRANDCSVSFRQGPRRLDDEPPGPADLDRQGRCWWWYGHGWLLDQPVHGRCADICWLPYSAIADPSAEP